MKKLLKQLLAVTTAIMMAITLLPAMANAEVTPPSTIFDKNSISFTKTPMVLFRWDTAAWLIFSYFIFPYNSIGTYALINIPSG